MGPMTRLKTVSAIATTALALVVAVGAYRVYPAIAPKRLTVENRTAHQVNVLVGTSYWLEVAPNSTGKIDTGWFPFMGIVHIDGVPLCDFEKGVKQPIIVDEAGLHCGDIVAADQY